MTCAGERRKNASTVLSSTINLAGYEYVSVVVSDLNTVIIDWHGRLCTGVNATSAMR